MGEDRASLGKAIRGILKDSARSNSLRAVLSPTELEDLFGVSTAVAFTLSQHLSAVERLDQLPAWQYSNQSLWESISGGTSICGLATTHLARSGGSTLTGTDLSDDYEINGNSPWVCGHEIFDKLIVGFETKTHIIFAIIDFPCTGNPGTKITIQEMNHLNGMGTIDLTFEKFRIPKSLIVSSRLKSSEPAIHRQSRYNLTDLGFGKSLLKRIKSIVELSDNSRHKIIFEAIPQLEFRLSEIEKLRVNTASLSKTIALKDNFNHDLTRVFAIATGADSLKRKNPVSRLQAEALFLENVLQPPDSVQKKIHSICSGS